MVSGIGTPFVSGRRNTRIPARTDEDANNIRGRGFQAFSRTSIRGATMPPTRAATEQKPIPSVLEIKVTVVNILVSPIHFNSSKPLEEGLYV